MFHGTRTMYVDGCRCRSCKDAERNYQRKRRNPEYADEVGRLFDTIAEIVNDRRAEWRAYAACAGSDAELFFADRGDNATQRAAKEVCAACPVSIECRQYALDNGVRHGIWAGRSGNRLQVAERQATTDCLVCGGDFPTNGKQRYCGDDCRAEARRQVHRRYHLRQAS